MGLGNGGNGLGLEQGGFAEQIHLGYISYPSEHCLSSFVESTLSIALDEPITPPWSRSNAGSLGVGNRTNYERSYSYLG